MGSDGGINVGFDKVYAILGSLLSFQSVSTALKDESMWCEKQIDTHFDRIVRGWLYDMNERSLDEVRIHGTDVVRDLGVRLAIVTEKHEAILGIQAPIALKVLNLLPARTRQEMQTTVSETW